MIATFADHINEVHYTHSHRMQKPFFMQFTAVAFDDEGHSYDAVVARLYKSSARTACLLVVNDDCSWMTGRHRGWLGRPACTAAVSTSDLGERANATAFSQAASYAGISFDKPLETDYDIEEAVRAIASALWQEEKPYKHIHITVSNP